MVMSPFEGSPPLEACTVDAILGRIYTIKRGLVRGLPSKMAKPTYQPSYRSGWARGRERTLMHAMLVGHVSLG